MMKLWSLPKEIQLEQCATLAMVRALRAAKHMSSMAVHRVHLLCFYQTECALPFVVRVNTEVLEMYRQAVAFEYRIYS
jgi:hypothetical protein